MTRVLYLIFFASGAAGLVYQVLWLRLTGLVFGNTSYSIAIVLGAFMAGLALGNWRLGIVSDRVARPLRMVTVVRRSCGSITMAAGCSGRRSLLGRRGG